MNEELGITKFLDNPAEAVRMLCQEILNLCDEISQMDYDDVLYPQLLDKFGMFQAVAEILSFNVNSPELIGNVQIDTQVISRRISVVHDNVKKELAQGTLKQARERYLALLGKGFNYEFSEGDLSKIQQLLNDLRERISASEVLEEKHKERLLKRLELLQAELHKKMTNLDKFWALAGEGAVLIQKYGDAAKPWFDIIRIILRIAWATQGRAEELPSNSPNILIKTDDQEIV